MPEWIAVWMNSCLTEWLAEWITVWMNQWLNELLPESKNPWRLLQMY
jgi:uncharacterized membrane protein